MNVLALRQVCHACEALHFATQCHVCKEPVIAPDERRELFEAFATLQNPLKLSFDQYLRSRLLRGCLRNIVLARNRKALAQRAANPASFELTP